MTITRARTGLRSCLSELNKLLTLVALNWLKHKTSKHSSGSLIRGRRAKAWAQEGPKRPRREAPGPPHISFLRDPPYIGISVISLGL